MTQPLPTSNAIAFGKVWKRYRHRAALFNLFGHEKVGEVEALQDFSLEIERGEIYALLGPNGSGKTTSLKLVAGMLLPDSGTVTVSGFDTDRHAVQARAQVGFAVANERSFYPRLTARENLDFFAALDGIPREERSRRVDAALAQIGLEAAGDMLAMKFSSGMFQRLGIARALVKQPAVLLLDEPSRSLDPQATTDLLQIIREAAEAGTTVLLTTHNLEEVLDVADRVGVLNQGRLLADHSIRAGASYAELRRYYFEVVGERATDREARQ